MNKCREEFEKWAKDRKMDLTVKYGGLSDEEIFYKSEFTRARYAPWCAAWEAAQKEFRPKLDHLTAEERELREKRIKRALSCMPTIG